jgi:hypothetical protein
MSLSTQLTRGTLALPMLALFGALALVAGRSAEAETLPPPQPTTIGLEARADATCSPHARQQLLLAQAPADLAPIAPRQGGCRA